MCRDFINVKDVVSANLLMLENDSVQNQVFCVGGGKAYTISEFAKEVATMYELENLLPTVTGEYRYGDTRNACSDISKIKKLGWSPKKTIQDSILEYKDYINEQDNLKYLVEYSKKQMKKMNIIRQTEKQI
jgi:dTDP-L-rhamnose 4-epimerase